jgi:hypothetical protein
METEPAILPQMEEPNTTHMMDVTRVGLLYDKYGFG